jgi:hypothetical protein
MHRQRTDFQKTGFQKWLLAVAMLCSVFAFSGFVPAAKTQVARAEQTELVLRPNPRNAKPTVVAHAIFATHNYIAAVRPDLQGLSKMHSRLLAVKLKTPPVQHALFKRPVFRTIKTPAQKTDGAFMLHFCASY